jgi:hypothetical protein
MNSPQGPIMTKLSAVELAGLYRRASLLSVRKALVVITVNLRVPMN